MRGYMTSFLCPCGGRIKRTILEDHFVCMDCNEDYGYNTKKLRRLK